MVEFGFIEWIIVEILFAFVIFLLVEWDLKRRRRASKKQVEQKREEDCPPLSPSALNTEKENQK